MAGYKRFAHLSQYLSCQLLKSLEKNHSSDNIIVTSPSDLWPHQCCDWSWQRFPRRECPGSEQAAPPSYSPRPSLPPSHTCCRLAVAPHLKKRAGEGGVKEAEGKEEEGRKDISAAQEVLIVVISGRYRTCQ